MEALQAKDFEHAKNYLSDSIKENAKDIAEYLGDFESIEFPKYSDYSESILAIRYADGTVKLYSLDFEDELISNISEYAF